VNKIHEKGNNYKQKCQRKTIFSTIWNV